MIGESSSTSPTGMQGGLVGRLVEGCYRVASELDAPQRRPRGAGPQLLEQEGFRWRFEFETRSLIELTHPHIVEVLDGGVVDTIPHVVLQYLSGGSLEDLLRERGGAFGAR